MSYGIFKLRRDTAANWTSANPTLESGEMGYETDTGKLKVGDGTTAWTSLSYYTTALTDGDKGDITVSSSGTIWNIDSGAVSTTELGGDITTAGKALLDDTDAAAQRTTLGLGTLATQSGTFSGTSSGTNTGDQSLFSTIAVAGQSNVVADAASDTLTLVAGTNITITTDAGTDSITINSSGGGDVTGPGSATDNAITRFDGTGGKTLQNSAATVSDDGIIRSAIDSGANAVTVPLVNWLMLTADFALTNTDTEQKYFDTTTNGTLTLPTGVYRFEWFTYVTGMSATNGNAALDPIGAGTAVTDRWGQQTFGIDNNNPLAAGTRSGSASVTQQTTNSAMASSAGTGMVGTSIGLFRISTGGTIIPSITLASASAATAMAGSYFRIEKIGESSETYVGAWT